jgi:hypothetical protein
MPEPRPDQRLYRVIAAFADGVFRVDVWADRPSIALSMALIDARMLHAGTVYTGVPVSFNIQRVDALARLRTDAHAMDDELEQELLRDYGVAILERDKAPWEWLFEGPRAQIRRMLRDHWTPDPGELADLDNLIEGGIECLPTST